MNNSNVHEIGLSCLVYVSRSTLALEGDGQMVNRIVSLANARNGVLRVTGALIYTELHFGQVLEGPARAIDELMSSILRDERHRDVTVVAEHKIARRRFENWAMAYTGASPYLDRHLKPLMSPATDSAKRDTLTNKVIDMMHGQVMAPGSATSRPTLIKTQAIG